MPTLQIAALDLSRFAGAGFWTAPAEAFRNFAHWSAPVAVTALWQGAVVAAGLALCLRFAPRVAAAHRFAAWAAGFSALVALPFVPAFSRVFAAVRPSATGVGSASLPHTAHPLLA